MILKNLGGCLCRCCFAFHSIYFALYLFRLRRSHSSTIRSWHSRHGNKRTNRYNFLVSAYNSCVYIYSWLSLADKFYSANWASVNKMNEIVEFMSAERIKVWIKFYCRIEGNSCASLFPRCFHSHARYGKRLINAVTTNKKQERNIGLIWLDRKGTESRCHKKTRQFWNINEKMKIIADDWKFIEIVLTRDRAICVNAIDRHFSSLCSTFAYDDLLYRLAIFHRPHFQLVWRCVFVDSLIYAAIYIYTKLKKYQ